jgi:carboxypeptidase Taq
MKPPKTFTDLRELSTEIHHFNSILGLLHWDQETYMPSGGITPRSHQISQLSELVHEKKTSRKFKECLEKLISLSTGKVKVKGLTKQQQVMLREWRKDFIRMDKLPASFIKTFSQVTSEASQIWASAKKENNFKVFAPFLDKIIALCRQKAEIFGFEDHPYDALLESYEPCMNTRKVGTLFDGLQKELTGLLKKINECRQIDNRFLNKKVDADKQLEIAKKLMSKLPMDMAYTRLDLSSHPFSLALHPHDSRITTRILPNHFMSNIFSVLHEAGHSFYEMGLPLDTWGTPLSEPASLSVHESQSRWWETLIGRSHPFCKYLYPKLQKLLPAMFKGVPFERFYRAVNKVSPTLIRVEADEVTYCLHVILRFEIEKELISGKLNVHDLPEAWNAKMKQYLGITPPNDSQGCLQDIHWSLGDFGYFPTYALGNVLSAHFFTAFAKEHSDWEKRVSVGDLEFIREWLKTNVHCWGRTYNTEELAKKVTGKSFNEAAYCAYLKKKYADIYKFR